MLTINATQIKTPVAITNSDRQNRFTYEFEAVDGTYNVDVINLNYDNTTAKILEFGYLTKAEFDIIKPFFYTKNPVISTITNHAFNFANAFIKPSAQYQERWVGSVINLTLEIIPI
jgi:hypothetical protein